MWMDDEAVRGSYPDPSLLALSGLERMKAGFRNQMPPPPIHHLFGLYPVSAGPASVTFAMPASPWLQSAAGVFFAGTSALVADAPLGGAILAALGPGKICVTSDLSLNFLRPMDTDSRQLVARARPIDIGNRVGLAEALIEDGQGRLVAHATTRCFIISIDPPPRPNEFPEVEVPTYATPDPHARPLEPDSVRQQIWNKHTFLESMGRQQRGERPPPPFAHLFGMHSIDGSEGKFASSMRATLWHTSPAGTLYGGVLAYFADTSLAGAFTSVLDENEIVAPLDLKVQFLRPAWPDGNDLRCEARVLHRGRTFATAHAEIRSADGKTLASATSSATIISGRSWPGVAVVDEAQTPSATEAIKEE